MNILMLKKLINCTYPSLDKKSTSLCCSCGNWLIPWGSLKKRVIFTQKIHQFLLTAWCCSHKIVKYSKGLKERKMYFWDPSRWDKFFWVSKNQISMLKWVNIFHICLQSVKRPRRVGQKGKNASKQVILFFFLKSLCRTRSLINLGT